MLDRIRKFLRALPFRSFKIQASSGKIFHVNHPENAAIVGRLVVIAVPEEGEAVEIISPLHIASVKGMETEVA